MPNFQKITRPRVTSKLPADMQAALRDIGWRFGCLAASNNERFELWHPAVGKVVRVNYPEAACPA